MTARSHKGLDLVAREKLLTTSWVRIDDEPQVVLISGTSRNT